MDRQELLRKHNKHLLKQLRQVRERFQPMSLSSENHKKERKEEEEERRRPEATPNHRGPVRTAPRKPSVRFADLCEEHSTHHSDQNSSPSRSPYSSRGSTEHSTLSDPLEDGYRHPQIQKRPKETSPSSAESCSVTSDDKDQRDVLSRVALHTHECEDIPALERHNLKPLLGYDWIAGVLDSDDSVLERSDAFFNDLCVFRSIYEGECVHDSQTEFSEESCSCPPLIDKDDPTDNMETHHCTFAYRINSRLFPVPLHSQECCPVCRRHKTSHPHTAAEPALVRVSIPRTTLLPSYEYKAHRRRSFDPSDSLALTSNCLLGWSNRGQSTLPPPSSLDLRSCLKTKNSEGSLHSELEDQSVLKASDIEPFDQIPQVSCLARHNFQHFSPQKKGRSTFYPAY